MKTIFNHQRATFECRQLLVLIGAIISALMLVSAANAYDPKDNSGLTGVEQNKRVNSNLPRQLKKDDPICICGCDGKKYTCNPSGCGALEGTDCSGCPESDNGQCGSSRSNSIKQNSSPVDDLRNTTTPTTIETQTFPGDQLKDKSFPGDQLKTSKPVKKPGS